MNVWPHFQIDVIALDETSDPRYEIHALTRLSDGTHFDVVLRGSTLRSETGEAIEQLQSEVQFHLDRMTKLPTTPGSIIQSLESNARYVLGLDDMWHSSGSQWTDEHMDFPFKVLAS